MFTKPLFVVFFAFFFHLASAQNTPKEFQSFDTSLFSDNAHHWYGIADKSNTIQPKKDQPRYKATELAAIADNILLYQKDNGGWPKNYDMTAILTADQKDSLVKAKAETNTTFDNRTTYSQIAALAKIYFVTKNDVYKKAAEKGLDFILTAQYASGGWPQYFPLEKDYSRYITYNDDAMSGIMFLLKDIVDDKPQYSFINAGLKAKLVASFNNGIACILKTQINDAGAPTAWCQQYNDVTLAPDWARKFEPPSICNGESVDVVLLLMQVKDPSKEIIAAVQNAVRWFYASEIKGISIKTIDAPELVTKYRISHTDRVVVQDAQAPPVWARYYELKTHRPLFCNRDSKVVYSLAEVDRERRDGYGWYTYEPQKVLNKYAAWQKKFAPDENVLAVK